MCDWPKSDGEKSQDSERSRTDNLVTLGPFSRSRGKVREVRSLLSQIRQSGGPSGFNSHLKKPARLQGCKAAASQAHNFTMSARIVLNGEVTARASARGSNAASVRGAARGLAARHSSANAGQSRVVLPRAQRNASIRSRAVRRLDVQAVCSASLPLVTR
eukprot:4204791-Pyramimonas_sp.AAC.1